MEAPPIKNLPEYILEAYTNLRPPLEVPEGRSFLHSKGKSMSLVPSFRSLAKVYLQRDMSVTLTKDPSQSVPEEVRLVNNKSMPGIRKVRIARDSSGSAMEVTLDHRHLPPLVSESEFSRIDKY